MLIKLYTGEKYVTNMLVIFVDKGDSVTSGD